MTIALFLNYCFSALFLLFMIALVVNGILIYIYRD